MLLAPTLPPPLVRVYDGSALRSSIQFVTSTPVTGTSVSTSIATTIKPKSSAGNTMVVVLMGNSTNSFSPPAGWTEVVTVAIASVGRLSIFTRYVATGDPESHTFSQTSATSMRIYRWEIVGLAAVSADATASNSGASGTSMGTGTTGTTAQADELSIAAWALPTASTNTISSVSGPEITLVNTTTGAFRSAVAIERLTATGTQTATATRSASGAWLACICTLKAAVATASNPFYFKGLIEDIDGEATAKLYDIGEFKITGTSGEANVDAIVEGDIIEIYVPEPSGSGWTHAWYLVRHISETQGVGPVRTITLAGPELKQVLADSPATETFVNERLLEADPSPAVAENWIRRYIDKSAVYTAGTDVPLIDNVPYLQLEAASGNRGSTYSSGAPLDTAKPLGDTISSLYQTDGLGWRVVLLNPGTASAKLEFQTFAGTNRTLGNANCAVFAVQWDTAESVTYSRDAISGITLGIVTGDAIISRIPDQSDRWGTIRGYLDTASQATVNDATAQMQAVFAATKEWAEVIPSFTDTSKLGINWALGDKVTTLTAPPDYKRFDSYITEIKLSLPWDISQSTLERLPELYEEGPGYWDIARMDGKDFSWIFPKVRREIALIVGSTPAVERPYTSVR